MGRYGRGSEDESLPLKNHDTPKGRMVPDGGRSVTRIAAALDQALFHQDVEGVGQTPVAGQQVAVFADLAAAVDQEQQHAQAVGQLHVAARQGQCPAHGLDEDFVVVDLADRTPDDGIELGGPVGRSALNHDVLFLNRDWPADDPGLHQYHESECRVAIGRLPCHCSHSGARQKPHQQECQKTGISGRKNRTSLRCPDAGGSGSHTDGRASGAEHEDPRRSLRFSGLNCAGSAGSLHTLENQCISKIQSKIHL